MPRFARAIFAVTVLSVTPAATQSGGGLTGKALYEGKCGGCHSVEANRIGPLHRGIVGRHVAGVPGYAYSPALKKLTGIWTPARLDLWLQNPQRLAPGTRMYLRVSDAGQRAMIIDYLKSVSPPAPRRRP